jgi:hypothetical protein
MEAFDFALGLRVPGVAVLLSDAQGRDERFEGVAAPASAGEAGGVDHAVVGECGGRQAVCAGCIEERLDD